MRIDLTYAGLTEQMLQRLRLAAQLLASRQIQAFVRAWDGTRCHVLVALTQDGYGKALQFWHFPRRLITRNIGQESLPLTV
jgi:hypothetical protein